MALGHGGRLALVGMASGVGLPIPLHRPDGRRLWVGAALPALGVHGFVDGAALLEVPLDAYAPGANPPAAVAMHKGLSAGPALTFRLAGPATNVTTVGVQASLHGRRFALRVEVVLTLTAVLVGWGINLIGLEAPELGHLETIHQHDLGLFSICSALVLLLFSGDSMWRQGHAGWRSSPETRAIPTDTRSMRTISSAWRTTGFKRRL